MSENDGAYKIRPYARLLTMLGEQLIKNDRIALLELVKNSYDADATRVKIRFENFGPGLATTVKSRIVIEDNGDGMTFTTVKDHWLNPATNIKESKKRKGLAKTVGGRVIQGEKGIGRFAMFKLGSEVTLTTRYRGSASEITGRLDIGVLDDPRSDESAETAVAGTEDAAEVDEAEDGPRLFLDELEADLSEHEPRRFADDSALGAHGTELSVGALRGTWSMDALNRLHQDLLRLRPLRGLLTGNAGADPLAFDITYEINGEVPEDLENPESVLESLTPRAVLSVVGEFEEANNSFTLTVNNEDRTISAASDDIRSLDLYSRLVDKERRPRQFTCGDFSFEFLVFDIRPNAEVSFHINPQEKKLIKEHRIYLYRDGVRVLPYGDPDDDWLQLDTIRGTVGANRVLSNDQTVGFVYISQEHNTGLRDKTNREGLIDSGAAYTDFIHLIQLLVNYLRKGDFARHLSESGQRSDAEDRRKISALDTRIASLRETIVDNPRAREAFDEFAATYQIERRVMQERVERTEDLAGVGLSVETASHDVVASANQAFKEAAILVEQLGYELGRDHDLTKRSGRLANSLSFIVSRLQDVQGLFVSSRSAVKSLDVVQYVRKIESIYSRTLKDAEISIDYRGDHKLEVETHAATLLQIFLNLVDNSVFWLRLAAVESPTIVINTDAQAGTVTYSDNGPGISPLDVPYIFDPFFSGRGDEGRGLGLYISRQVARRDRLEFELIEGTPNLDGRIPATFRLRTAAK